MTHPPEHVALVGHCGPDSYMLRSMVSRVFPSSKVAMVNNDAALQQAAESGALLLVNRVLDGAFPTNEGVALIDSILKSNTKPRPRAMLISDRPDAQARAQAIGAFPGFGKRTANTEETRRLLLAAAPPPVLPGEVS